MSNLFDNLSTNNDEVGNKFDSSENVKRFIIPKKEQKQECLLSELPLDSREYRQEFLPLLTKSLHNSTWINDIKVSHIYLISNAKLQTRYSDRKKELKLEGRSDRELLDGFLFYLSNSAMEFSQIISTGLHVDNIQDAVLGHPKMGATVQRYFDILQTEKLVTRRKYKVIMFKYIKGKSKLVGENHSKENYLEPFPNYDAHVSKCFNVSSAADLKSLYYSSQVYLYEYGDDGIEAKPRHIYPYAAITFKYRPDDKSSSLPSKKSAANFIKPSDQSAAFDECNIKLWKGLIYNKGLAVGFVSLYSCINVLKPSRIGNSIVVDKCIKWSSVKSSFLNNLNRLSRKRPCQSLNYYLTYYEMRSESNSDSSSFCLQMFIKHLIDNKKVAVASCESGVLLMLIPTCELSQELGLSNSHIQDAGPPILHCVFVSRQEAGNRLLFRKFLKKTNIPGQETLSATVMLPIHNHVDQFVEGYRSEMPFKNRVRSMRIKKLFNDQLQAELVPNPVLNSARAAQRELVESTVASLPFVNAKYVEKLMSDNQNLSNPCLDNQGTYVDINTLSMIDAIVKEMSCLKSNASEGASYLSQSTTQMLINLVTDPKTGKQATEIIKNKLGSCENSNLIHDTILKSLTIQNRFLHTVPQSQLDNRTFENSNHPRVQPQAVSPTILKGLSKDPRFKNRESNVNYLKPNSECNEVSSTSKFSDNSDHSVSSNSSAVLYDPAHPSSPPELSLNNSDHNKTDANTPLVASVDKKTNANILQIPNINMDALSGVMNAISNPETLAMLKSVLKTASEVSIDLPSSSDNNPVAANDCRQDLNSENINSVPAPCETKVLSIQSFDYGHKNATPLQSETNYFIIDQNSESFRHASRRSSIFNPITTDQDEVVTECNFNSQTGRLKNAAHTSDNCFSDPSHEYSTFSSFGQDAYSCDNVSASNRHFMNNDGTYAPNSKYCRLNAERFNSGDYVKSTDEYSLLPSNIHEYDTSSNAFRNAYETDSMYQTISSSSDETFDENKLVSSGLSLCTYK